MEQSMTQALSFANLFDPAQARAAAEHAARWKLPRRVCHPLDTYRGRGVSADVAAYDAQVESAPVAADEASHDDLDSVARIADTSENDESDDL